MTTDIIAGFPGETASEHNETLAFIERVGFSKVHVFPYSRRSGTPADRMPCQLTNKEKSDRARELIAKGRLLERQFLSRFIGRTMTVLVEENSDGSSFGCTDNYIRVRIPYAVMPGTLTEVRLDGIEEADGEIRLTARNENNQLRR